MRPDQRLLQERHRDAGQVATTAWRAASREAPSMSRSPATSASDRLMLTFRQRIDQSGVCLSVPPGAASGLEPACAKSFKRVPGSACHHEECVGREGERSHGTRAERNVVDGLDRRRLPDRDDARQVPAGGLERPASGTRWALVFVRCGAYRRRADGVEYIVDGNTGFVRRPGEEWSSAVFTSAYEELTVLEVDPDRLGHLPDLTDAAGPVPVEPDVALAHRLLVGALRADELQLDEGVLDLAHRCMPSPACCRPIGRRHATAMTRRRLVADCVELLNASYHEPFGLLELARRVGSSPYHLSRVFREVTGTTISQYRTRLRVHAVLERLDEGDDDLSAVAAATGFADHGHMTRTLTGLLGAAPSVLRSRLDRETTVCSARSSPARPETMRAIIAGRRDRRPHRSAAPPTSGGSTSTCSSRPTRARARCRVQHPAARRRRARRLDCSTTSIAAGIRTGTLMMTNRRRQVVLADRHGLDAGWSFPQFSIHRGRLQRILADAVHAGGRRPPSTSITASSASSTTNSACGSTSGALRDVTGRSTLTSSSAPTASARRARPTRPRRGRAAWNGAMMWHGATEWPAFLDGRTMIVAGGNDAKLVVYLIGLGGATATRLTNWGLSPRSPRWPAATAIGQPS